MERMQKFKGFLKRWTAELILLVLAVCGVGVLCLWMFKQGGKLHTVQGIISAVLSLALFVFALMLAVPGRYASSPGSLRLLL